MRKPRYRHAPLLDLSTWRTEPLKPLEIGPLEPEKHRCDDPRCIECWNCGQRYADHLKARKLENW